MKWTAVCRAAAPAVVVAASIVAGCGRPRVSEASCYVSGGELGSWLSIGVWLWPIPSNQGVE